MVDFIPASTQTQALFTQFQNGTAWDMSSLTSSQNLSGVMSSLSSTMGNVPSLASSSASLATFASVPMNDLSSHLGDQFNNLPQSLQLGTSQISNALGMGTGNPKAACQSAGLGGMASMLGSVMGMANNLMSSAHGQTSSAAGLVAGKIGAGVIHHVLTNTPSTQATAAILPFASIADLEAAMMNPTPANLNAIGMAITHLSALSPSLLGSLVGSNGTTSNLSSLGSSVSALSSPSSGAVSPLSSIVGAVSTLNSAVSSFVPGGIAGIMKSLGAGGLANAAQSMVSAVMGKMGNLGGIMNNVTNMIAGEKAALGAATKALTSAAAAYNLPLLNGNACAAAVINAAGSQGLKDALNGSPSESGTPTTPDGSPSDTPNPDGTNAPIPDSGLPLTNSPMSDFQSGSPTDAGVGTIGEGQPTTPIPGSDGILPDSGFTPFGQTPSTDSPSSVNNMPLMSSLDTPAPTDPSQFMADMTPASTQFESQPSEGGALAVDPTSIALPETAYGGLTQTQNIPADYLSPSVGMVGLDYNGLPGTRYVGGTGTDGQSYTPPLSPSLSTDVFGSASGNYLTNPSGSVAQDRSMQNLPIDLTIPTSALDNQNLNPANIPNSVPSLDEFGSINPLMPSADNTHIR